jgi:hypothetical protein
VNNTSEVAFVRRGGRGAPAVSACSRRAGIKRHACKRSEFSSVVSVELKSVIWTDFQKTEEV